MCKLRVKRWDIPRMQDPGLNQWWYVLLSLGGLTAASTHLQMVRNHQNLSINTLSACHHLDCGDSTQIKKNQRGSRDFKHSLVRFDRRHDTSAVGQDFWLNWMSSIYYSRYVHFGQRRSKKLHKLSQSSLVDRPTQLICISDVYLSTYKYKRHSRAIC